MRAALREARPEAFIEVVVLRPAARELFAGLGSLIDSVVYLPYWERGALAFVVAAARLSFRPRSDAVFLTYPAARFVYLVLLALVSAKRRFVHRYTRSPLRKLFDITTRQIAVRRVHNVLRNVDLLTADGIDVVVPNAYTVPPTWRSTNAREARRIVMHVGTIAHDGLEARRWPEERFAELGRRLTMRGYHVQLLTGPAERDATERVARAVPGSTTLSGSLEEIAPIIGCAAAVVANDNGIAHLAAGVGARVLALFGPTPVEHGPYGAEAEAFRPSPCPPCFDILRTDSSCKLDIDYACLKRDLPVDLVEQRLVTLAGAPAER